ncbi:Uncharacterized protein TSPI_10654 [Trichinella spiralis]|uniref:Uncharacterized protein n=1 Tax=Trichinella spiralis TaxID=6334 RepID=A0ABR3K9S5_TRISP
MSNNFLLSPSQRTIHPQTTPTPRTLKFNNVDLARPLSRPNDQAESIFPFHSLIVVVTSCQNRCVSSEVCLLKLLFC